MRKEPQGLLVDAKALFSEGGTLRGRADLRQALRVLLVKPGVQALLLYRLYRWLYLRGLRLLPEVLARLNFFLTGAEIDPGAEIGPGCHIWHTAGVTSGRGCASGPGCGSCTTSPWEAGGLLLSTWARRGSR